LLERRGGEDKSTGHGTDPDEAGPTVPVGGSDKKILLLLVLTGAHEDEERRRAVLCRLSGPTWAGRPLLDRFGERQRARGLMTSRLNYSALESKKNRTCVGFGVQVQDVCETGQLECPGDWHAQAKTNST